MHARMAVYPSTCVALSNCFLGFLDCSTLWRNLWCQWRVTRYTSSFLKPIYLCGYSIIIVACLSGQPSRCSRGSPCVPFVCLHTRFPGSFSDSFWSRIPACPCSSILSIDHESSNAVLHCCVSCVWNASVLCVDVVSLFTALNASRTRPIDTRMHTRTQMCMITMSTRMHTRTQM